MIKTKNIIVSSKTEKKSGVGEYGAWTLTEITDQDNWKYGTFHGGLYEVGNEYLVTYKEEIKDWNGKGYTNRTIQDNPAKKTPAPTKTEKKIETAAKVMKTDDEILARLARIEEKLDKVAKFVGAEL